MQLPLYRLRLWTGPTAVHEVAERLRAAGLNVALEGTQHVYILARGRTAEGAAWDAGVDTERAGLRSLLGRTGWEFCHREPEVLSGDPELHEG